MTEALPDRVRSDDIVSIGGHEPELVRQGQCLANRQMNLLENLLNRVHFTVEAVADETLDEVEEGALARGEVLQVVGEERLQQRRARLQFVCLIL